MHLHILLAVALLLSHAKATQAVPELLPSHELVLQHGHDGSIGSLSFSPDGTLLATGGADNTVRIWNVRTGLLQRVLSGYESTDQIQFLQDGRLATCEGHRGNGVVRFWNMHTGALLLARKGPGPIRVKGTDPDDISQRFIAKVAISPDGRFIARANEVFASDASIRSRMHITLQDSVSGKMLPPLRAPTQRIRDLAFSSDSRTLAAVGWLAPVLVWDVETAKLKFTLPESTTHGAVTISPDSKYLACSVLQSDSTGTTATTSIHIWDLSSGKIVRRLPGTGSQNGTLQFTSQGLKLISGDYDKIRIWNIKTGRLDAIFNASSEAGISVTLSPDGQKLAGTDSMYAGDVIRLWDIPTRQLLWSREPIPGNDSNRQTLLQNDGRTLQTVAADGSIRLWSLPVLQPQREYRATAKERIVALSPDGKLLVVRVRSYQSSSMTAWEIRDAATGRVQFAVPRDSDPDSHFIASTASDFSHDGKLLAVSYVSDDGGRFIKVWDVAKQQPIKGFVTKTSSRRVMTLAFSLDNKFLALGDDSGAVSLFNTRTGVELGHANIRPYAPGTSRFNIPSVRVITFSGANQLAASDGEKAAKVWDIGDYGIRPSQFQPMTFEAPALLAFSHDGKTLAGSDNRVLTFWNAHSGRIIRRISTEPGDINSLIFSADGRHIIVGRDDNTVQFWRVADGELAVTLWPRLPPDAQGWLALTPNNFYTGSNNIESIMLWRTKTEMVTGESLKATYRNDEKVALALERWSGSDISDQPLRQNHELRLVLRLLTDTSVP